jgi:hypothetical protein
MLSYYFLSSLGLCFILKYATVLNFLRTLVTEKFKILKELSECSMCLGFWCGVVLIPILWKYENFGKISLLYPFASSAFCWTMDLFLDALVAITTIAKEECKEFTVLEISKAGHKEVGKTLL